MLYRVFIVQWLYPCQGDWTLQVKIDLEDFGLPVDLTVLKKYSKPRYKNLVKLKATEFTFNLLLERKFKYKKLSNLHYTELKTQEYLLNKNLSFDEQKTIFLLRTRMANFGENFKGDKNQTICPLCKLHIDSQSLLLQCPEVKKELQVNFSNLTMTTIDEVYLDRISEDTAKLLNHAMTLRNQKLAS